MYQQLLKPLLFRLDAEAAHHLGLGALSLLEGSPGLARALRGPDDPAHATTVFGLTFPNRIGLAAGLDKNAEAMVGLFALGFGFVEVGTVTPRPQPGNDRPRLFRVPEHGALLNRMGFNNLGAHAMASRLSELEWRPGPIGVNLGKNKDTPNERAHDDYALGARLLAGLCDYLVVNLSSPNTPGLRALQEPEALRRILQATRAEAGARPVLLKIAPDLEDEAVDAAVEVAVAEGAAGLIATNTTVKRPFIHPEAGGLSGRPLLQRSTEVLARVRGRLPTIGVGGVFGPDDVQLKLKAGASLVQIYSGLIYQGPRLVKELVSATGPTPRPPPR
ncbi:MAG: quinone-dependent dihydroorotate dehydrogenase [Archangiaceae bacterium]|nr:quinone-dependent dihydroorotate dehydrogenase [Archangiaceae bacterium]